MWKEFSSTILRLRAYILVLIGAYTLVMAYQATKIQWSFEYLRIIPDDDPDMLSYDKFRSTFGEDGNSFVIGVKDPRIFQLDAFKKYQALTHSIAKIEGVRGALSLANVPQLDIDRAGKRLLPVPIFPDSLQNQQQLDSLLQAVRHNRAIAQRVFGKEDATAIAVSLDSAYLNSERRMELMHQLIGQAEDFSKQTGIRLYYAGLPHVRTIMAQEVKSELSLFLGLSIGVTALVMFAFFRSPSAIFYALLMVGIVIVSVMGTLGTLGYKITILTGLLPPIMVVIGIPNFVYFLNKYHQEFVKQGDRQAALSTVIKKIGVVTLLTNATTAIGFLVLLQTGVSAMQEFGIVAGLNILLAFLLSITFLPAVFSFLPDPDVGHMRHLEFGAVKGLMDALVRMVQHHRRWVYGIALAMVVASAFGIAQLRALSYMVDDVPDDFHVKQDLFFFQDHFAGVMPLELVVDTGRKKGYMKGGTLQTVEEIEDFVSSLPEVSPPVSMITLLKAANQAFNEGDTAAYRLPNKREMAFLYPYLRAKDGEDDQQAQAVRSFVDSTGQYLRISMKMADVGSHNMDSIVNQVIRPVLQEKTKDSGLQTFLTGTTLIFLKGNDFLIANLKQSMALAFVLIAGIMGAMFGRLRIVIISLIPNIVPLLFTAGMMGFLGIPLKPSTALVFSIVFGISVDDTIHFLAKYRQEVKRISNLKQALQLSILETGPSMLYTSIILFGGFIIFVFSSFGGTIALGILTSMTLLVAMLTNLTLLPCLLYSFDVDKTQVEPYMDGMDEFYFEDEDEDIEVSQLQKKDKNLPESMD